jgi:hypothetical protein
MELVFFFHLSKKPLFPPRMVLGDALGDRLALDRGERGNRLALDRGDRLAWLDLDRGDRLGEAPRLLRPGEAIPFLNKTQYKTFTGTDRLTDYCYHSISRGPRPTTTTAL